MNDPYSFPSYLPEQPSRSAAPQLQQTVLYGTDLRRCSPPEHTAQRAARPLVVFQDRKTGQRFGLTRDMLSKHLLLLGGIGSGKTNTVYFLLQALLQKITEDDLVIIFDSKGDFYRQFQNPWDPRQTVIGNGAAYDGISSCWNIFDELRNSAGTFDKSSELAAKEIAKSLFEGRESTAQPFFSLAATDVVAKVLIDFIRHRPNQLNNAALVAFFHSANAEAYHQMIDRNRDFESIRDYFGKRGSNLTAQALGVLSYVATMVNDIFVGIFAENRSAGSFSMRQLVRHKGGSAVFVEYDLSAGEVLGPIYGLMYDLALKEALGGRSQKGNVYIICDEFRILPKLKHINDALNLGRSLGVKVVAGLQTIDQLYEVYGEELGKTIAAGFMNSMCFQTWDLSSREFISDRFGKTYSNLEFHSMSNPVSTQREGRTVEDWDILGLEVGEAFINLTGEAPFRFCFQKFD